MVNQSLILWYLFNQWINEDFVITINFHYFEHMIQST